MEDEQTTEKEESSKQQGEEEITCLQINQAPASFVCAKVSDDSDWLWFVYRDAGISEK